MLCFSKIVVLENSSGLGIVEVEDMQTKTAYDCFLSMFTIDYLGDIVNMTNGKLEEKDQIPTSISELLKFFGTIGLMNRDEFSSRWSL